LSWQINKDTVLPQKLFFPLLRLIINMKLFPSPKTLKIWGSKWKREGAWLIISFKINSKTFKKSMVSIIIILITWHNFHLKKWTSILTTEKRYSNQQNYFWKAPTSKLECSPNPKEDLVPVIWKEGSFYRVKMA